MDLSPQGEQEALQAAQLLKAGNFVFDRAYTSVLKRAIHTLWIVLKNLDLSWIPVTKTWAWNERHYGGLQGLNKLETVEKHGEEQVFTWRRSYDVRPPALEESIIKDSRYEALSLLPKSESLKDTQARVVEFWKKEVVPQIQKKKKVFNCGPWKLHSSFGKTSG